MALSDLDPRLLRVTYASRAADWLTRKDLRDIAAVAQTRNRQLGVTGLLLHIAGDFFQVLEGPSGAVETLFEKIEADRRNKWVTRLSSERIIRRAFEDWSMGCFEVEPEALTGEEPYFTFDADSPTVRTRVTGDFTVFLDQFYARNRARVREDAFVRAL